MQQSRFLNSPFSILLCAFVSLWFNHFNIAN